MSLSAKYKAFLASPSSGALADSASLHYITTLTSINDAPTIIKHLAVQEKMLKKKEQKVLSAIEGTNGQVCVDVEMTIEFISGGGAYLPGLDDNFVADRIVTLPMVHIVAFDGACEKITQIRQYWDQGSLLKQIDVIGARARNWPIRDGKDQLKLIATSAASTSQPESAASSRPSTAATRDADEVSVRSRPSRRTTNNAMNDPHASLSLFENRQPEEEGAFESQPRTSRAQSAKPPPRNLGELFVKDQPGTPAPKNGIPGKAGGGKNFKPNRLFDEGDEEPAPTPMSVKTNSKKYDHFEFADENEDTPKVRETSRPTNTKHQSQWDFADFTTPEKSKTKVLANNERHFGWSDDEVAESWPSYYPSWGNTPEENSPVRREVVHKPRKDADTHFEFKDDGTPDASRKKPFTSKGRQHNTGLGLYKDHVTGGDTGNEFDTPKGDSKGPLNDVTHVNNEIRQKDFGAHWEMKDNSPGLHRVSNNKPTQNQQKVLKTMDANWGNYEPSPEGQKIKIAGNGMGGRSSASQWSLYDEDPESSKKENTGVKSMGNGMGGRKGATSSFNWDF
ncbi:hypothetical protein BU23DRAFT_632681 [Bimuria novae-zelandiae CBS 107.79]|uniref:NTF2-like protein n=1 Tax=Bimuria novae-zelandiae CBS 107.79 TaxID=1447943 RepID=A0A6A5VJ26_9PLEO|nr:hypothetical protein BU23DRAFT_632681 [Bimuria novae-zelandiae CBS 107.79]